MNASKKFTVDKAFVSLCGQTGKAAETLLTYHATGTSDGFTVKITASNVSVEILTIDTNTTPP